MINWLIMSSSSAIQWIMKPDETTLHFLQIFHVLHFLHFPSPERRTSPSVAKTGSWQTSSSGQDFGDCSQRLGAIHSHIFRVGTVLKEMTRERGTWWGRPYDLFVQSWQMFFESPRPRPAFYPSQTKESASSPKWLERFSNRRNSAMDNRITF